MNADEIKKLIAQYPDGYVMSEDGTAVLGIPVPGNPDLVYVKTPDGWEVAFAESVEQLPEDWDGFGYDIYTDKQGRRYRTKIQAERAGAIIDVPKTLPLITLDEYRDGLRPVENAKACIRPVRPEIADKLQFVNGTLYFEGLDSSGVRLIDAKDINLSMHYDMEAETIAELDLPTLRVLYSIILQDVQNMAMDPDILAAKVNDPQYISHSVKIYVNGFLQSIGYDRHLSRDSINYAVKKIMSYHHIVGVLKEHIGDSTYNSIFPVLVFHGYNDKDGTLTFCSPYLNVLVASVLRKSFKTDKKGRPQTDKNGKFLTRACHSYLIKSSIAKERNKPAVEIVCVVVETIEKTGSRGGTPHISVQSILDHCPELKIKLDAADSSRRHIYMQRAFSKAWELLGEQTLLKEKYPGIQLPSKDDIPKYSDQKKVFEFPHSGKINATKVPNSQWQPNWKKPNWSKPDLGKPWEDDEDPAF